MRKIYVSLGQLIELLRFGLPTSEDIPQDPHLLALEDQYKVLVSGYSQFYRPGPRILGTAGRTGSLCQSVWRSA